MQEFEKHRLVFDFLILGALLAPVRVLQSTLIVQRGEFQHCMISDPKNPAGQPQQINNGLMDLVLLINLCGIGKHSRTVSL